MVKSQSPQIGALSPSKTATPSMLAISRLNPLKSGLCLRRGGAGDDGYLVVSLNPLKSGLCLRPILGHFGTEEKAKSQSPQIGALSPSRYRVCRCVQDRQVSIPSNRGSVSVATQSEVEEELTRSLNPLKSGLCLRPYVDIGLDCRYPQSQSPQIGALSPSDLIVLAGVFVRMSQSPQIGALSPSVSQELGRPRPGYVSIPSNRGSVSVH